MKKPAIADETLNRVIKYLVIVLLGLAILYLAIQFGSLWSWILNAIKRVIVPVGLAYLFALIIFPVIKYLEKKGIGPRGFSLGIVFIISVGLIFAFFYFIVPILVAEIQNFFNRDFPSITEYLTTGLRDDFIFGKGIYDQIYNYISDTNIISNTLDQFIPNLISTFTSSILPIVSSIALLPILLIYYLLDYETIGEKIRSIVPQRHEKGFAELTSRLNQTVGAYLRGQLFLMVALGSVAVIVYRLIGLKYYFLFGVLVGVTNIIPYFGMIIAALPPIIYTFINTSGPGPLLVLAVNVIMQFIEGNFFQPMIMSYKLSIHPIIIIISILFFGSLFGPLGVIFASPIASSIRVIYNFVKEKRRDKKMETIEAKGS